MYRMSGAYIHVPRDTMMNDGWSLWSTNRRLGIWPINVMASVRSMFSRGHGVGCCQSLFVFLEAVHQSPSHPGLHKWRGSHHEGLCTPLLPSPLVEQGLLPESRGSWMFCVVCRSWCQAEHKRALTTANSMTSALAEHAMDTGHNMDWSDAQVVDASPLLKH